MKCRTTERREWIVNNYYVVPKAHIKLLANQEKNSDAGGIIEDEYYIFEATSKTNGKREVIQCGMGAARDFLRLLNHKGLPIFNPIHNNISQHNGVNDRNNNNNDIISKWNPTSKQLYNAIMWIITIIDASPNSPIYNIKSEIEENPNNFLPKIKGVNTIIHGVFKGVTLTEKNS